MSLLLFSTPVQASLFRIAVIDTGLNNINNSIPICPFGSYDFTGKGMTDVIGHGTAISNLIHQYAKDTDYCQMIIKVYHTDFTLMDGYADAIDRAVEYRANLINISGGGMGAVPNERYAILRALNSNIIVVVAAGNDNVNLDKNCKYFPACYDKRIVVAGNMINLKKRNESSNYGSVVDFWPIATNLNVNGKPWSGTSMGAAIISGTIVKNKFKKRGPASNDEEAVRTTSYALYKQLHLDVSITNLKNKYVAKSYQDLVSILSWGAESMQRREYIINYRWCFP